MNVRHIKMKFINKVEAIRWCEEHSIALNQKGLPVIIEDKINQFSIPPDSGKKIALVKQQFEQFRSEEEILIWILEWGVWLSSERMHIFDRFRESYGEKRKLHEIEAHIFNKDEYEDALSFLSLAVLFFWDCYVLNGSGNKIIFYSHDEYGLTNV